MTLRDLLLAVSAHALAVHNGVDPLPDLPEEVNVDDDGDYTVPGLDDDYAYVRKDGKIVLDNAGNVTLWTSVGTTDLGALIIGETDVTLVDENGDLLGAFDKDGTFTAAAEDEQA
ncbi:MAG: hypothetical protein ACKVOE_04245 [Rickettsiales bacterium]